MQRFDYGANRGLIIRNKLRQILMRAYARGFKNLSSSWFEPMPGSHTFCFSNLEAIFRVVVQILYQVCSLAND
jgi:hypothetical protein